MKFNIYAVPYWKWDNFDYVDPACPSADGPQKKWTTVLATTKSAKSAREIVTKTFRPNGFGKIAIVERLVR